MTVLQLVPVQVSCGSSCKLEASCLQIGKGSQSCGFVRDQTRSFGESCASSAI